MQILATPAAKDETHTVPGNSPGNATPTSYLTLIDAATGTAAASPPGTVLASDGETVCSLSLVDGSVRWRSAPGLSDHFVSVGNSVLVAGSGSFVCLDAGS